MGLSEGHTSGIAGGQRQATRAQSYLATPVPAGRSSQPSPHREDPAFATLAVASDKLNGTFDHCI
jgi:hypothetical protein